MEADGRAAFEHVAGIDLGHTVWVEAQDLRVAVLGRADGEAELVLVVENPAGNAIGVLA